MDNNLFSFIFNTIRQEGNNPQSPNWLPKALEELGLPLRHDNPVTFTLGADQTKGEASIQRIIGMQWFLLVGKDIGIAAKEAQLKNFTFIPYPQNPLPEMTLKKLVINGLENIEVLPSDTVSSGTSGYQVIATAYGPAYDKLPRLNITGEFTLRQTVCAADLGTAQCTEKLLVPAPIHMKWPIQTMVWSGSFSIDVTTDTYADAHVDVCITGMEANRALAVQVKKNVLRGAKLGEIPVLTLDETKLTVTCDYQSMKKILKGLTLAAFSYSDTQETLVKSINSEVSTPHITGQMTTKTTVYITRGLDRQLGAPPTGRLPSPSGQHAKNPVDQYLFDRVRFALTDASGAFYLPNVIKNSRNPVMDPFSIPLISLGDYEFQGMRFANITLADVKIGGLSAFRMDPEQLIFEAGGVIFAQPVLILIMNARFSFLIGESKIDGDLTVTLKSEKTRIRARFGGGEPESLTVDFAEIALAPSPADISITVKLKSIFLELINRFFNGDKMKLTLTGELNKKIDGERGSLSRSVTAKLREVIKDKMG